MKYCLGLLTVELHIPDAQSLKDRRRILSSLKERLRQRFNISITEADFGDKWQRGGFVVSAAGQSPGALEQSLRSVVDFLQQDPRIMVITPHIRFYE